MAENSSSGGTSMYSAPTRSDDPAWAHGQVVPGVKNGSICIYCNKRINGGGVTRLKYHLAGIKGEVEPCKKVPPEVKWQMNQLVDEMTTYPAFKLLYEMIQSGFVPDPYTYSSLIRGLCVEGMLDEALEIFRLLEENDYRPILGNFNALILGLCKSGRTDLSLGIFEMMIAKGHTPNETTYTIIVEGIAHEEEKELAAQVLKELYLRQVIRRNTVERLVMQYDLKGLPV